MIDAITRAKSLGEHIVALERYARGYDPRPEPSQELARAIVEAHWMLLHENEQQRCEIGALRTGVPVQLLDTSPGLELWRRQVLEDPSRRPLERIAALELTAAISEGEGDHDIYTEAMSDARAIASQAAGRSTGRGHAA